MVESVQPGNQNDPKLVNQVFTDASPTGSANAVAVAVDASESCKDLLM